MTTKKSTNKTLIQAIEKLFKKQRIYIATEFTKVDSRFDRLEEKINLLPTKDEHFKKMDEAVSELQKERDEHTVMRGQLGDHEERIEKVEKKLHISPS